MTPTPSRESGTDRAMEKAAMRLALADKEIWDRLPEDAQDAYRRVAGEVIDAYESALATPSNPSEGEVEAAAEALWDNSERQRERSTLEGHCGDRRTYEITLWEDADHWDKPEYRAEAKVALTAAKSLQPQPQED